MALGRGHAGTAHGMNKNTFFVVKESHGPRVFFSVRKGTKNGCTSNAAAHKRLGGSEKYGGKTAGKRFAEERTEFIAEEEESD